MNPANCGYPQSVSLPPVDHDFITAYHVRVNVWYMWLQYNILSCKVAIIWFILCQRSLQVRERLCVRMFAVIKSCWGIRINYSILIPVLKYNKPSTLAIGLETDAAREQERGSDAIRTFPQEHFRNLQHHWIMKMLLPNRSIHSCREMCIEVEYLTVIWVCFWIKGSCKIP